LGIGDWGLGIGPNPQSPIPNPQYQFNYLINNLNNVIIISLLNVKCYLINLYKII